MRYIFSRLDKENKCHDCECEFHMSSGRFTIYFDEPTPAIGLNDGNFHPGLTELHGKYTNEFFIDKTGIYLNECFVKLNGKWHIDGILLKFKR